MNEDMKNFIISCVKLGEELLGKKELSEKEREFIENIDIITDKYFN